MTGRVAARALPVGAVVAAAVTAAVVLSPTVRHQLAVSFVRQPQQYLELYLAQPTTARTCPATAGRLPVAATVRSHLSDPAALAWAVTTSSSGHPLASRTGTVRTTPGQASTFTATVPVPAHGGYDVAVTLPGHTEHLLLHCGTPDGPA